MNDQFGQIAGRLSRLEDNVNRLMAQQTDFATSGSAFPTDNLFTGREFFRTDLGLLAYYNGTRWLTVSEYTTPYIFNTAAPTNFSTANTNSLYGMLPNVSLFALKLEVFVLQANNGSAVNFWDWTENVFGIAAGTVDTKTFTAGVGQALSYTSFTTNPATPTVNRSVITTTIHAAPGQLTFWGLLTYKKVLT